MNALINKCCKFFFISFCVFQIVSQLLEAGSLVDERESEHEQSPLFAAMKNDYTEAVELLIKYG